MHRRDFTRATLALPLLASRAQAAAVPVVMELFTSQGCSSCPPADAFLGEMVRRPGIIGLAWHVDYWDSLGWRDPYARREWTDRQRAYAKYLGSEVYTPALVVNGAAMVVGSDKAAIQRAIDQAAPPVAITLRRAGSDVQAEIGAISTAVTGLLVTYDPQQATRVDAGENEGRRLMEYRVVRNVRTLSEVPPRLTVPAVPEHQGIALLIQDKSWRVVGAADLPPVSAA